ncbi:ATP-binding protein [Sphingobacterium sp. lm-10]|uniref:tetratricopeptide repeat-containing sensor histidine kinase n=1 Tax=Sphingobacterium sp. lm-10 TaxID=2944904 RepID=UPI002020C79E|nr:ATP-binding protein [Sphingobacterium sp. lm-10]MCL7987630.1 ATP-binding protein [Sphingobacterium sp. lm-10]
MKNPFYIFAALFLLSCSDKPGEEILIESENYDYDQAYVFLNEGKSDSAFLKFSQAKDYFQNIPDSLNVANCLLMMAMIQREAGDYFGGQETALQANDFLDQQKEEHYPYLSSNYNTLGRISRDLKNYEDALSFFKNALIFSQDSANISIFQNNIALVYENLKQHSKADEIFQKVLSRPYLNRKEYARTLSNLANARWENDPSYIAAPELLIALAIRIREKDFSGQNASYAHLADYYKQRRPDSSLFYARKQYVSALKIKSPDAQVKALRRLIQTGNRDSVQTYFNSYSTLTDSLDSARKAAKNQFALIRYEVEKNKADNLRLENDNIEKSTRLTRQRAITGGLTFLIIFAGIGGNFWYKKRKERLELEAQNKIKASKLATSRKVHDVVANGIYRVMNEIEYNDQLDRDSLLDKLDTMYNKSRDISYEAEELTETSNAYHDVLGDLLKSFAKENRRVLIAGNDALVWEYVSDQAKSELTEVLLEMMVNMAKHSHAESVAIRFSQEDQSLQIHYQDDGVGMKADAPRGKGIDNTVSRIQGLRGEIIFASEAGDGLKIDIRIPIYK